MLFIAFQKNSFLKNEEIYFRVLISKATYNFRSRNVHQDKNDKNHPRPNFARYTLLTLFICKSHNYHDIYNLSITSVNNIPNYSSSNSTQYSEFCDPQQMEKSQKSHLSCNGSLHFKDGRLMRAYFDRISY